jgi:hypothetical protein
MKKECSLVTQRVGSEADSIAKDPVNKRLAPLLLMCAKPGLLLFT